MCIATYNSQKFGRAKENVESANAGLQKEESAANGLARHFRCECSSVAMLAPCKAHLHWPYQFNLHVRFILHVIAVTLRLLCTRSC